MALVKLNIAPLPPSKAQKDNPKGIDVLFNPNSYSIQKTATWTQATNTAGGGEQGGADGGSQGRQINTRELDAPPLVFGGGGSRTLTLELFFDVTEKDSGETDVRALTNKIATLALIDRDLKTQPPVCHITWGKDGPPGSDFPFDGVISNLTQRFSLFRATGEPVRANLTVAFTEYIDPEMNKRQNDPELTTHVVKRGETLSGIAAQYYRNAALWRVIAEANRIDDPRRPAPGTRLVLPKVS